jgi:hypothetical protein
MTTLNLSPPHSERWRRLTARLERVNWPHSDDLLSVVLDLAIGHLEALRDSLEGVRTPATSWQSPWLEAQYPVTWDWARHRRHFASPPHPPSMDDLEDLDRWGDELASDTTFSMFHFLTRGLALLREGGLFEPLISVEVMERLETVPAAHQQSQLETELQGMWFSDPQVMSLSGTTRAGDFDVAVVVQMHPLLIDADNERVHYPVVTGLDLRGTTPQRWPDVPLLLARWLTGTRRRSFPWHCRIFQSRSSAPSERSRW